MFPSSPQFPNVGGYFKNVGKEVKQYGQALTKTMALRQDAMSYPPASAGFPGPTREQKGAEASAANRADKKAFGQLSGAVFLGRKYDDKSGKRIN